MCESLVEATATLACLRGHVLALVEDGSLFTDTEHLRTNESVYQSACLTQLKRGFRNVRRVYAHRSQVLRLLFTDGLGVLRAVTA